MPKTRKPCKPPIIVTIDGNGVELYWDRPKEKWPKKADGSIEMYTRPLDLQNLLLEL